MRGASLKTVQQLPGHATIDMTLRYSHLTPTVKREAVRWLDRTETTDTVRPSTPGPLARALRSGRTEGSAFAERMEARQPPSEYVDPTTLGP